MPDQVEPRAVPSQRPESLRAAFAVNRDRLAVQFYAIGSPEPQAGGIRLNIQDKVAAPRRIDATSEATQLASSIGRNLADLCGPTNLQPAPLNPAILALIK